MLAVGMAYLELSESQRYVIVIDADDSCYLYNIL